MKTTPILTTEQRQQQHMLPQQVQYVRLLEMNGPEVEDAVRQAVDENPALEVVHDQDDSTAAADDFNETAEEVQMADYSGDEIPWYRLEASNHQPDQRYYEPQAVASTSSLIDQLTDQLTDLDLDDLDRRVARYIIGNLDDNGYMTRTVPELASDLAIAGVVDDEARVRSVWQQIRSLEPAGVGAMDLRDALLLQLQRLDATASVALATEIVKDYFDLFSKKHYDKLAKLLSISPEQLKEAVEVIRRLNPKPGATIDGSPDEDRQRQIVPEFSVDVDGDTLNVTLLTSIPELMVSPSFSVDAYPSGSDQTMTARKAETNAFIKQRRDEATGFIRTLQMRQDTMMSVMRAIVTLQSDFFRTGDRTEVHPILLKDVSQLTGLD
ncbi:MAG: RNA polymerase sigma-54 factor, partial [Muribaculaceae bacterium]|nr:RNA polymerase sigma-54 factor [Muribaculaceae bacterium]